MQRGHGKGFPKSTVVAIDYHGPSAERGRNLADPNHLTNVKFIHAPADQIPQDMKFDLVCSFDCIHDMVNPRATLRAIHEALSLGAFIFWFEPNASAKPHENRNPIGRTFQAISPLHCIQIALLVAPVLVLLAWLIGTPMSLLFTPLEVAGIGIAVAAVTVLARDRKSMWLEGVQLLAIYVIFAVAVYLMPATSLP
jgi:SAM-dependent methyltransferase